jgi:hypothetical protein
MKNLVVQIHPNRVVDENINSALEVFQSVKNRMESETIFDVEKQTEFVNIHFSSSDVKNLWRTLSPFFLGENDALKSIRKGTIVVCQGEVGWEDYLLLYHFDKTESLDQLR